MEIRELFIDELAAVQGGGSAQAPYTTRACCEEGPFGCCWIGETIEELIGP